MNFVLQRLCDYAAKRLSEPSTIAGFVLALTGLCHYNAPPEVQALLTQIGLGLVGLILFFVREGRNRPDNPNLSSTIKGEMPPAAPAIVPPSSAGMQPVARADKLAVDATGVVHDAVPPDCKPAVPAPARRPIRPDFDP